MLCCIMLFDNSLSFFNQELNNWELDPEDFGMCPLSNAIYFNWNMYCVEELLISYLNYQQSDKRSLINLYF